MRPVEGDSKSDGVRVFENLLFFWVLNNESVVYNSRPSDLTAGLRTFYIARGGTLKFPQERTISGRYNVGSDQPVPRSSCKWFASCVPSLVKQGSLVMVPGMVIIINSTELDTSMIRGRRPEIHQRSSILAYFKSMTLMPNGTQSNR